MALTNLCGINAPTMDSFKLPKWHRWTQSWEERHKIGSCKPLWAGSGTPLPTTPTQKGGFSQDWKWIMEPDCWGPWNPDYGVKNLIYSQRKIIKVLELGQTKGHMSLSALCLENLNPAPLCKKCSGEKMEAKRQKLLCYNKGLRAYWGGCANRKVGMDAREI